MASPSVTVIVPVFNAAGSLAGSVQALLLQKPAPPARILIVDDGSTDGSRQVAEALAHQHPDRVGFILRHSNGGEAAALNAGFTRATGDLIGIVEADVLVAPDWLARLTAKLEGTGAWGVGGALRPFPGDSWIARLAGYEVQARQESQRGEQVRHVSSANVLYRHQAWEEAGPFREDLLNASLDSDFNARLLDIGGRLAWDPEATAWHHYKPTLAGLLARTLAYARTRWRVSQLALYPADRHAAALLLFDVLSLSSLAWGWVFPEGMLSTWLAALAGHAPMAWEVVVRRRDPAGMILPFVLILRGGVAALGLGLGLLEEPVSP